MANKKTKKSKVKSKKSKVARKKPGKKVAKKVAKKKAVKKKVTRKVAKKKPVVKKKAAKKKAVKKKAVKKQAAKKKVVKKKIVAKKPAPKKVVHSKPLVKKEVKIEATAAVMQQEASHSGEHRESFTPHVTRLKAGDDAPDFSGPDQHGNIVSLGDFQGKTLVLYFYPKDDTDGCTAESCSLRAEYPNITGHNHQVVGVSADDVESHKKFAEKYDLPFSLVADTNMDIIKAYDVWGRKDSLIIFTMALCAPPLS